MPKPSGKLLFCCQCDSGPWNPALYSLCIDCEHPLGKCCEDKHSKKGKTRRIEPKHAQNSKTGTSANRTPQWGRVRKHQSLRHPIAFSSTENPVSPPLDTFFHSHIIVYQPIPEQAHLDYIDADPAYSNPTDGEEMWICCSCGMGPVLAVNHDQCVSCEHVRCDNCKTEN